MLAWSWQPPCQSACPRPQSRSYLLVSPPPACLQLSVDTCMQGPVTAADPPLAFKFFQVDLVSTWEHLSGPCTPCNHSTEASKLLSRQSIRQRPATECMPGGRRHHPAQLPAGPAGGGHQDSGAAGRLGDTRLPGAPWQCVIMPELAAVMPARLRHSVSISPDCSAWPGRPVQYSVVLCHA